MRIEIYRPSDSEVKRTLPSSPSLVGYDANLSGRALIADMDKTRASNKPVDLLIGRKCARGGDLRLRRKSCVRGGNSRDQKWAGRRGSLLIVIMG